MIPGAKIRKILTGKINLGYISNILVDAKNSPPAVVASLSVIERNPSMTSQHSSIVAQHPASLTSRLKLTQGTYSELRTSAQRGVGGKDADHKRYLVQKPTTFQRVNLGYRSHILVDATNDPPLHMLRLHRRLKLVKYDQPDLQYRCSTSSQLHNQSEMKTRYAYLRDSNYVRW